MSQLHTDNGQMQSDAEPRSTSKPVRAPLINRMIDPSNVVFSLVFCQQTRREFEMRQPG